MKKYILIGIAMSFSLMSHGFATIGQINVSSRNFTSHTDSAGNVYAIYKNPAITVITPKSFSSHFFIDGTTAKSLASAYSCSSVLNATYFGYHDDGSFYPAGVWYKFGAFLKQPYQPALDKNLTVLLSGSESSLDFLDNDSFDFATILQQKNTWYANIGPWLVRDGKINQSIVKSRSHRQRNTTRSGIIRNPDGQIKFVISTQAISLPQFIVFAYVTGIGTGSFQFVNLDGGSSTSLVTPYISYQAKKNLPSFICIH